MSSKSRDEIYSRALSRILRHRAVSMGLSMGADGFVPLHELLALKEFDGCTVEMIQQVVAENKKQRFELVGDGTSPNDWKIRAVQGHTIDIVQDELLLTEITDPSAVSMVLHGTYRKCYGKIMREGLNRMKRNHMHFATDFPASGEVISGMRTSAEIVIQVDLPKALAAGIKFYLSKNGVVLSKGIHDSGVLPTDYFQNVVALDGKPLPPIK